MATLLQTFDAENGVVGQNAPAPLSPVTGPNSLVIVNNPIFSGTKSYEVTLDRNDTTRNPYRTEVQGVQSFEFERVYWLGIAVRRAIWGADFKSNETWLGQIHETPGNVATNTADWVNWGQGTCVQSAFSTSPYVFICSGNTLQFIRLPGVVLWTKPLDINVWHTIVVRVKLSKGTTGFIESWYDGVQQARFPTTGTAKTHRADNEINSFCCGNTALANKGFVKPKITMGIYKWDWKEGRPATDQTIRVFYLDALKVAIEDIAGDSGNGFALVNPIPIPDTTAPVISNLTNVNVNATTRTITWNTNEPSTSVVNFGITTAYGSNQTNTTLVTAHSVTLNNLAGNTTYNYQVRSADAAGNIATSANNTFTTPALPATITNIVVVPTATGATITWDTGEARSSILDYGLTTAYGTNQTTGTLVTSHSKTITGLTANTLYNFKVSGTNAGGTTISSANTTFTTLSAISNIVVTVVTTDRFRVDWTSSTANIPSVRYGLTTAYGNIFTKLVAAQTDHSVNVTGLTAGTTYNYQVGSLDDNIWSTNQVITLTAASEGISAIVITNVSPTSVTITWTTLGASDSTVTYGIGLTPGTINNNASLVTSHSITLTGLEINKTYFYKLKSITSGGAVIESTRLNFKTRAVSNGQSDSF